MIIQKSKVKRKNYNNIYEIVKKIPKGKVATYGLIAKLENSSNKSSGKVNPRLVGRALHENSDPDSIPCHRVVNSEGKLAEEYAFGGWKAQKKKLLSEGVGFKGVLRVNLDKHQWKI